MPRTRTATRTLTALAAAALGLTGALATAAPATAAAGSIHPGVMTYTAGAQCTANFVFRDATSTYIGQAAHCSGTGGSTEREDLSFNHDGR